MADQVNQKKDFTQSLRVAFLLTFSGGFFDSYSYLERGKVFANAETGNIVLLGLSLFEKNLHNTLLYLYPVVAFALGVFLTELIKMTCTQKNREQWKLVSLVVECCFLMVSAFLGYKFNSLVNIMISFVCGIQVNSFRAWRANPFATTMCTGNLRSGTELLYQSVFTKDWSKLFKSMMYFLIIADFIAGAAFAPLLIKYTGYHAIAFSTIPLMISILYISKSNDLF